MVHEVILLPDVCKLPVIKCVKEKEIPQAPKLVVIAQVKRI